MRKLEAEGVIDIANGKGCYLAGAKPFKIVMHMPSSALDFGSLHKMLQKHINRKKLNIEVELREWQRHELAQADKDNKVVMVSASFDIRFALCGLVNFSFFDGFEKMKKTLKDYKCGVDQAIYIPFYAGVSQMGVNLELLKKLGLNLRDITCDFKWWNDFKKRCKDKNIIHSSRYCDPEYKWWFGGFRALFFNLLLNEKNLPESSFEKPIFDTASGARLLDIMASHIDKAAKDSFFKNKSVLDLSLGSWVTMQKNSKEDFKVKDFAVVPYSLGDRKICALGLQCLQTFIYPSVNAEEKKRLWAFVQMLVSKPFQLDFCNLSGMLSVNKNIKSNEYAWNNRPDFSAFMPGKNDIVIPSNIFNPDELTLLGTLFEQYVYHGADKEAIQKQLDLKLNFKQTQKKAKGEVL